MQNIQKNFPLPAALFYDALNSKPQGADLSHLINAMGEFELNAIVAANNLGLTRLAIAAKFTGGVTVRAFLLVGQKLDEVSEQSVIYADYIPLKRTWVKSYDPKTIMNHNKRNDGFQPGARGREKIT